MAAVALLAFAGVSHLAGDGWTLSRIAVVPDLTNEMGTVTQDFGSNSVEITTSGTALGPGFDQMLFYHVPLGPTGSITARVDAPAAASGASAKAGLMIRASADPTAPHAAQFAVSAATPSSFSGHGYLSRADADSDWRVGSWAGGGGPLWVRLVRAYGLVEGYTSTDGSNWTLGGSAQVDLPGTALAGLFAANDGQGDETFTFEAMDATGAAFTDADGDGMDDFWEWRIFGTLGRSTAPSVTWLSPTNGEAIAVGAPVYLAVSMTDRELVSAVDFFADGTNVGQDATYPYAVPWSNSVVGAHSLWAQAAFGQGATTASAPVSVTIFDPDPDGDGSPDAWELEWFGSTTNPDAVASADPDGDGMTNGFERLELTSPLDYFNGALPEMEIVGGDMQGAGTNAFLAEVLAVRLSRPSGLVYSNAPVTFSAPAGGLAPTNAGQTFLSLDVRADANGIARAWHRTPSVASTNAITATASNATDGVSVALTAFAGAGKPTLSLLAPDNLASEPGLNRGLFQVVRTGNPWISVTAQLGVSGTASNGLDYDSLPTNLLLSAGLLTGAIEVVVRDDTDSEAPETVVLRLLTNSAYSVGSPASNTVTVADNDSGGGTAAIEAGDNFSAAVMYDGSVWTWGSDASGALGNGGAGSTNLPAPGPGLAGVKDISCGALHMLALMSNGAVNAWGEAGSGRLGNNDDGSDKQSPDDVDNLVGAIAVSAGDDHSMALTNGGKVFCWGDNQEGQVGVGTEDDGYDQPQAPSLTPVVTLIRAGRRGSYAIKNGVVYGAGHNKASGTGPCQLAHPSLAKSTTFMSLTTGSGAKIALAAGYEFCLVIKDDNRVYAWGDNGSSQLGLSHDTVDYTNGVVTVPGMSNAIAVAAGRSHSMALRTDGSVWTWGRGNEGQLGDGDDDDHERITPVQATAPGFSNIIAIAAGKYHSMALDKQGWIWVWGDNGSGQLGLGDSADRSIPTRIETLNLLSYPPAVQITSPSNGLSLTNAAGRLALAATAEDPDGSVARVDFYEGTNLIGSDTSAPFTATWTNLPVGTWTFTAKATDNKGVSAVSAPVAVTIYSDGDILLDTWEQAWFGNLDQDPGGDADGDGLTNEEEQALNTNPTSKDSDGDLLTDKFEADSNGAFDPTSADDIDDDFDGDGLSNLDELIFHTDPTVKDSDGDGTWDGAEVAQSGRPNDSSDGGQPPDSNQVLSLTLGIGDESGSHSEDYHLVVERMLPDGSWADFLTVRSGGFGEYDERNISQFRKGEAYRFRVEWQGSNMEDEPDYDGTALIAPQPGETLDQLGFSLIDPVDPASGSQPPGADPITGEWSDVENFPQTRGTLVAVLAPIVLKQLNFPTSTDTTDMGPTEERFLTENQVAYITGAPEMPQLQASLGGGWISGLTLDWRLEIKSERGQPDQRGTQDDKNYPTSGYTPLPSSQPWNIHGAFGQDFIGGKGKLLLKVNGGTDQTMEFKIRGKNPKDADAKGHILNTQGAYRFAWAMVQHESRQGDRVYNQFNSGGDGPANLELPNFTGPDGWGISQLDEPLGVSASTMEVYSWNANVEKFYLELAEKESVANSYFDALRSIYEPQGKWEEPPATFIRQGTATPMSALEAATLQLYNGAAWLIEVQNGQITYDGPYTRIEHPGSRYISCWSFHPNNSSGQKWEFIANQNNYVYKLVYDEFESHAATQE